MSRVRRCPGQNGRRYQGLYAIPGRETSSTPPCPYLSAGTCTWGDSCRFSHDDPFPPPPSFVPSSESSPVVMTPATSVSNPASESEHYRREAVSGHLFHWRRNLAHVQPSKRPCHYYANGYCRDGSRCQFLHADSPDRPVTLHPADVAPDEDADEDAEMARQIFPNTHNMAGVLVRFGDGVVAQHVFLPTEISAAHLTGLPPGTTTTRIQKEFARRGFHIALEYIHLDGTSAAVISTDTAFANAVCGLPWTWSTGQEVVVSSFEKPPLPLPADPAAASRVSSHKVRVHWPRRSEKLIMTWSYSRGDSARFVATRYHMGTYRVKGERVKARYLGAINNGHMVELSGLPDIASTADVDQGMDAHNRPNTYALDPPPSPGGDDLSENISHVQRMFTAIAPIEDFQYAPCSAPSPDFLSATVQFADEEDARKAVAKLNGLSKVALWRRGSMVAMPIYTASFRIKTVVWDAIFSDFMDRVNFWMARNVVVRFRAERTVPFKSVRLEGMSPRGAAASRSDFLLVKDVFETLLRGKHVFAADGTLLWHPVLANGDSIVYNDIQRIARDVGVLVQGNISRSQLRMFGPRQHCRAAGYRLRLLFGILGRHPLLTRNPDERPLVANAAPSAEAVHDCVACCTPSESLVSTPCNHEYCPECFRNGCIAGASTEAGFRCVPEDCKAVIPLPFVEGKLPPAVFGDVLRRAFGSYMQRHSEQLRFCSSPACGIVYRLYAHLRSGNAPQHVCGGCLSEYCPGCGSAPHSGYTCEDYREIKAGTDEYTRSLRRQLGIKDCPKCGVGIEKVDGCNHVKCTACDCHMCWKCLFFDKEERSIYAHMQEEHGRYVDGASDNDSDSDGDSDSHSHSHSDSDEGQIALQIYYMMDAANRDHHYSDSYSDRESDDEY